MLSEDEDECLSRVVMVTNNCQEMGTNAGQSIWNNAFQLVLSGEEDR